jgi:histidinol-phosphate aminotransferase
VNPIDPVRDPSTQGPIGAAPAPAARPEVESLQAYSAPLEGRRGLLRLDFNENTVGPSPQVVAAIRAIPADHYAIYPEYDGLRQAVMASLQATPGGGGALQARHSARAAAWGGAGAGREASLQPLPPERPSRTTSEAAAVPAATVPAAAPDAPSSLPAAAATATATATPTETATTKPPAPTPAEPAAAAGLRPEQIGLFNGVDAAIHAVFQAYGGPGDRLLTTSPTFGYYTPCARMQGMAIEAIPYRLPDFRFPLEEIRAALLGPAPTGTDPWTPPRLLLLCNPNNPTGTRLAPERILELAAAAPQTLVVVDELYEAFTGDSVLPLLLGDDPSSGGGNGRVSSSSGASNGPDPASGGQAPTASQASPAEGLPAPGLPAPGSADPFAAFPNLLVLRSLSKTAGIAGLRIGFAIGSAALIDRVSRVTGPYDINSFAVTAAHAALADQAYVDAYVAEVLRARDWLVEQLRQAGVRHHVDGGNYLLLWPDRDPDAVDQELRAAGILVRSMAGKPLIDGSLRVSLGTQEQMEHFWSTYRRLCGTVA